MWLSLSTIGCIGSENGEIIADEEYKNSCRITLEKCKRYCAITCGIYGGMVHTAFVDNDHCLEMYEAMKSDLQKFIDKEISYSEEFDFYCEFTSKY